MPIVSRYDTTHFPATMDLWSLLKMENRNPSWFIKNIIQAIGNVPPDEVVIIIRFIDSRIMSKK
jgi:hypothetical protein